MDVNLSRCANAMRASHEALVMALMEGIEEPRKNRFIEPQDIFRDRISETLELLIRFFEGSEECGALYLGLCIFELYQPERSVSENSEATHKRFEVDGIILFSYLAPLVSKDELQALKSAYKSLISGVTTPPKKHVRTLFVGDCLMMEIVSFLIAPLTAKGISIDPFPINSRDPHQLRNIVANLSTKEFDVIFVSPFSHNRLPEIKQLLNPTNLLSKKELNTAIKSILEQTQLLLDFLSARFECPIYIHNSLLIPRSTSLIKTVARLSLTWRARLFAKRKINEWILGYIADKNTSSFQHLFLLDENALIKKFGKYQLSRFLHTSKFQHATVLSQKLAVEYNERISTVAELVGKKLIICDLEQIFLDTANTENSMVHLQTRQTVLKQLQAHGGIILSIVTKNKSSGMDAQGGLFNDNDFIAAQIGITNKIDAIQSIKDQLNLQTRHMIFMDTSKNERTLVTEAFPDMLTLDPSDSAVWERIALWEGIIHSSSDVNRTQLYQEQLERDEFVASQAKESSIRDVESLKKLGLVIDIHEAKKNDLKRVVELINRTNQWNLCGSRTNLEQVQAWHTSTNARILIANAQDRFGDMGVACVAVMTTESDNTDIPIFVLSCRVFGYGVETAMLNEIAKLSHVGSQKTSLTGHCRPTNQNHLSRNMYLDHGFQQVDEKFVLKEQNIIPSVPWAEVRVI